MTPMTPAEELAALYERLVGLVAIAHSNSRKMSAGSEEADRLEGSFIIATMKRAMKLHEDYAAFMRRQVEAAKQPSPNGAAQPQGTKR